jgi:hypothetical protein
LLDTDTVLLMPVSHARAGHQTTPVPRSVSLTLNAARQRAVLPHNLRNDCNFLVLPPSKERAVLICHALLQLWSNFLVDFQKHRRFVSVAGKKTSSAHQRDQRQQIFSCVSETCIDCIFGYYCENLETVTTCVWCFGLLPLFLQPSVTDFVTYVGISTDW